MSITFTVPGIPIPKERARVTSRGTFTPEKTRAYEAKVKLCARAASVRKIDGPVSLLLELYLPDRRRRDCENIQKAIQDALNGIAYQDDSQVKEWHGCIRLDPEHPRAVVTLHALADPPPGGEHHHE